MKTIKNLLHPVIFLLALAPAFAQTWQPQAIGVLPPDYGLFSIAVVDENTVWATAFDFSISQPLTTHVPHVIKTTDGGANWTDYPVVEATGRWSFDIVAFDENTAWITTIDLGNGTGQGLFRTEDGGETWTEVLPEVDGGVWVRFFDEMDGVCINRGEMATTSNGGQTWEAVEIANIPDFETDEYTLITSGNNSLCAVGDRLYFGTNKGRVFRSVDRGHNWEALEPGFSPSDIVYSVSFIDSLNGIAVAPQTLNVKIARTRDGGDSWEIFNTPAFGAYFQNVAYVPGTDSTFVSSDANSATLGTYYSKNFGKTWQNIDMDIPYRSIGFASPQIGWVSRALVGPGNPAIYKWDDDLFVSATELPQDTGLSLSPNPFEKVIFIDCSEAVIEKTMLYNASGILVAEAPSVGTSEFQWQLPELGKGIYFLHIRTDKGTRTEKLIRN